MPLAISKANLAAIEVQLLKRAGRLSALTQTLGAILGRPLYMKKHFKIKHRILQILVEYQDSFPIGTNAVERGLHYSELEKKIPSVSKNYLLDTLHYLATATKEIHCSMESDNSTFLILENGRASYIEGKYKSLGSKELRDNIFDVLKIVSTTVLLLIAIYTVVQNFRETKQNKVDIEKMKSDIQKLQKDTIQLSPLKKSGT